MIIDFLSNLVPGLTAVGMTLYAILLFIAMITSAALKGRMTKAQQLDLLKRYNYSAVSQRVLALHTRYDEAFHWVRLNAAAGDSILYIYWVITAITVLAIPFAVFIGWHLIIPLIILSPLLYITGMGVRALVRTTPWAIGEGMLTSMMVRFATANKLNTLHITSQYTPCCARLKHSNRAAHRCKHVKRLARDA